MKRKFTKFIAILAIMTLVFSFTGCGKEDAKKPDSSNQTSSGSKTESSQPRDIKLQYAKNFNITYLNDGMKVTTDGKGRKMLLLKKGQTAPEEYKELPQVTIPVTKAVYTSVTQMGYLRAFENDSLYDSIVGTKQKPEESDIEGVKQRLLDGRITNIGGEGMSFNFEIAQSLNPNLMILSSGSGGGDDSKVIGMMDQSKIPYSIDGASEEGDYRGTMEWIKYYAAFYDLDKEAEDYFNKGMKNVNDMITKINASVKDKPKVSWNILSKGTVYVGDAGSKAANMIKSMGGDYIYDDLGKDKTGNTVITAEELFKRLNDNGGIYISWNTPKYCPNIDFMIEQVPSLADLEMFKKKENIWQLSNTFWTTYHDIDKKFLELGAIIHPELFPDVEITNYVKMK